LTDSKGWKELLEFFGSPFKIASWIFLAGLILLLSPEELRKKFYLADFINSYGLWIGAVALLAFVYILISATNVLFLMLKELLAKYRRKGKILNVLIDLGIEE
jgi:hypothetical protein